MKPLLLSRTLDPADYAQFEEELAVVDGVGTPGQHPHRRWEYALALHAIYRWAARGHPPSEPIYDVGGGGSLFEHMVGQWTECQVHVIDPVTPGSSALDQWLLDEHGPMAEVVTCISVIEHIGDLDRFLHDLNRLVAPGGLLVLTMDYWNHCGPDTAENRDLRKRIFCPASYRSLQIDAAKLNLRPFGGVDLTWHGAHVHDYSFASLVLEKRR